MGRFINLGIAIVNTSYIIRVEMESDGRAEIYMSDGTMFRCDHFDAVFVNKKSLAKGLQKKRAPSTPNKLVRTAWGEPQRTPFGTLTDHALLQEFWSPFARVGRTKRSRPFAHILEPPSPFSKRTALPVHGLRKTVAFTGENHNMAVVD